MPHLDAGRSLSVPGRDPPVILVYRKLCADLFSSSDWLGYQKKDKNISVRFSLAITPRLGGMAPGHDNEEHMLKECFLPALQLTFTSAPKVCLAVKCKHVIVCHRAYLTQLMRLMSFRDLHCASTRILPLSKPRRL